LILCGFILANKKVICEKKYFLYVPKSVYLPNKIKNIYTFMKKLLYLTLSLSAMMVGCKGSDGGSGGNGGGGGTVKGPNIEFQTNTGTFSGYTFSDDQKPVSSGSDITIIKIGVKITSDINLKSTKMTYKFNNQAEVLIMTDSVFTTNTKTCNRDYFFQIPADEGTYTLTAYATDKDATTKSAKIVITAYRKLAERSPGFFSSLQSTTGFSAFDLLNGEAITAATGAGNEALRDIVDQSINSALSGSWKSQNGTQFVISGTDGKLNGKTYTQFQSQIDILNAWNASTPKATNITGVALNKLIIAKSNNGGTTRYYLIAIDDLVDEAGSDDDGYSFQYKE
jgi:hypothetical protein